MFSFHLLTFKHFCNECNEATQQNTSVVSEGGVRVPKRGVVKFSQNLSLWLKKEKNTASLIMWFLKTFTFKIKVRLFENICLLGAQYRDGTVPAILPQGQQEGQGGSVEQRGAPVFPLLFGVDQVQDDMKTAPLTQQKLLQVFKKRFIFLNVDAAVTEGKTKAPFFTSYL